MPARSSFRCVTAWSILCSASRIEPSIVTGAPSMDRRPDVLAGHHATDVPLVAKVEHEDRQLVLHAERYGGGVHHAVSLPQEIRVPKRVDPIGGGIEHGVGGVDADDLRPLEERIGVDLEC